MKIYRTIIAALCALFVFGCNAAPELPRVSASPTETLQTFLEASKKKDVETIKKTLSKGTMSIIEDAARMQNTTVDELLKKDSGVPLKELPETRNEKIEGDAATVEVKNVVTGEFDRIPFVKEEDGWKIALDKLMQEIQTKAREQMTMPPAADSDSNAAKNEGGAAGKKETTNKSKTDK